MKMYHLEFNKLKGYFLAVILIAVNVQCQRSKSSKSQVVASQETNTTQRISEGQPYGPDIAQADFQWPEGKKMGLSLTFDDARLSQADKGIPLLDKHEVKGTFYLSPENTMKRLDNWKQAVNGGHELGNHSLKHACSGNFSWSRNSALEDYSLDRMRMELDSASTIIKAKLGVSPVSFAYPCGQTYLGRGVNAKSYIPLVASMFETGRGWLDEGPNDPGFCDMAQLTGMELDGKTFKEVKKLIDAAQSKGQWLILVGHEMDEGGAQTSILSTIDSICMYASNPDNGIWVDNVHNIASYIKEKREEKTFSELPLYKNPLYSIDQRVEDLLSRMTLEEKLGQINMPAVFVGGMGKEPKEKLANTKKFAEGKFINNIGPAGGFFATALEIKEGPRQQAEFLNELQKIALYKTRLQIPLLFIEEGTHGLMVPGATIFPEGSAIGSTWNMGLINKLYKAAARETKAIGVHGLCTIVIEPIRDPRLGRNMEGYSEDPYLCAQIAGTIVKGMQGEDISNLTADDKVICILTHFPGQGEPFSGLERGAINISERKLREVFLPPWVAGITKAGGLGVMATYPTIDGEATHGSVKLLTKILRQELGFEGIVLEEGGGFGTLVYENIVSTMKEAGELAIKAGVDVGIWLDDGYLNAMRENVQEGKVSIALIDRSVRRVLRLKFLLGLFEYPYVDVERAERESNTKENRKLAFQTAHEGIVLLKNEHDVLPLDKDIKSIAVIGPNADNELNQLGDYTATPFLNEIVTILEGIKNKVSSDTKVSYVKGCEVIGDELNQISQASEIADNADIAIVVLGEGSALTGGAVPIRATVGEGNDVASLDLTGFQEEMLKAVFETGTPTVVVLINGRPLSIRWAAENIPAIVEAWIPGEEGGNAVADVLFGDYNPDGRLPVTFPRHSGQLPMYYNYPPSKRYWVKETWSTGYSDMPATPLWEFGYGLSYTTFEYSNLKITPEKIGTAGEVYISVDVKNTGKRDGKEVVQLYIDDVISSMSTPVKELKGFEKVSLSAGEKKSVKFKLTPEHLTFFDRHMEPIVEPGIFEVMVGSSSENIHLKGKFEVKR